MTPVVWDALVVAGIISAAALAVLLLLIPRERHVEGDDDGC